MSGGDRQYLTLNTYSPNRGNYNDMWNDAYIAGINNAQLIINDASASDLIRGIAEILQGTCLLIWHFSTETFHLAKQCNQMNLLNPTYDAQATVVSGGISFNRIWNYQSWRCYYCCWLRWSSIRRWNLGRSCSYSSCSLCFSFRKQCFSNFTCKSRNLFKSK